MDNPLFNHIAELLLLVMLAALTVVVVIVAVYIVCEVVSMLCLSIANEWRYWRKK